MVKTSKIIELGLESRTRELNSDGLSLSKIAKTLSNETKQHITVDNVFRYLKSDDRFKAEVIEKKEELQVVVLEAEISTIEDRQTIVKGLLDLAYSALEDRDRVLAFKEANIALDSLDKRIGKLSSNQNIQINNSNVMKIQDVNSLTDEQLVFIINNG